MTRGLWLLLALVGVTLSGCHAAMVHHDKKLVQRLPPTYPTMPRELSKVVLPKYVIEPPDILQIELLQAVPKAPYRLKSLDVLGIQATGTLPESPIGGIYAIEPGGTINLGPPYGLVRVSGMTTDEVQKAIETHLKEYLKEPQVTVALAELGAAQQVSGQFIVGPDGTVTLGNYGSVLLVGQTIEQAKATIESFLAQYLEEPKISLNIFAYNSKVYYVITQGAGLGDGVYRFPVTGNETVLDAISQINGLNQVSSKRIWISRPTSELGQVQILPVDWFAITEQAATNSNYQILPGDRVFVAEDKMVAFDTHLAKVLAPFERIMGFSLLGATTATRFSGPVLKGGGNRFNNNGF
ncbi:MAG TPA: polysaccharide biosynthesis/export family protein [Pirellulaceae bacterium]|nr:polysaccharide biosynthesis/export family protein [Pirellulaceae bacterium]